MMPISVAMLYDENEVCLVCRGEKGRHAKKDCPGVLLDGLEWEITFYADSCNCCLGVGGSESAPTLEACVAAAGASIFGEHRISAEARLIYRCPAVDAAALLGAECSRIEQRREAEKRARELAAASVKREAALAALEAQREDLTSAAYARKKAVILGDSGGR